MFKVYISDQAKKKSERFILSYRSVFLLLYSDTWLINEKEIRDNYVTLSKKLSRKIETIIFETFREDVILWKRELEWSNFLITRKCEWFFMHLEYTENLKLSEREITNITFYKK